MTLRNFIKENFVLAIGLTLPLLLVLAFFLTTVLPKSLAVPPQYEMVFTVNDYTSPPPAPYLVDFFVKDNHLMARLTKNNGPHPNYTRKKLMTYDAKAGNTKELPYSLAHITDVPDKTEIALPEFAAYKIDSNSKAPDGYTFTQPEYHSGGLMQGFFWGGSYRSGHGRISKGMTSFKIPQHNNKYYYNEIQFVGWVISK